MESSKQAVFIKLDEVVLSGGDSAFHQPSDPLRVATLSQLIQTIRKQVSEEVSSGRNVLMFVDQYSTLVDFFRPPSLAIAFVSYLHSLVNNLNQSSAARHQHKLMVLSHGSNPAESNRDDLLGDLVCELSHTFDMSIHVAPLPTGYSKDVNGKVRSR